MGRSSLASTRRRKTKSTRRLRGEVWCLLITAVVLVASLWLAIPPQDKINQGLDIQGGLSVVLTANTEDGQPITSEDLAKSRAIIENRVNALGASEATVTTQGTNQILVQIPGMTNAQEALDAIGQTGVLEFADVQAITDTDKQARITAGEGNIELEPGTYTPVITGENIEQVTLGKESETSQYYAVNLRLDSKGAADFGQLTTKLFPSNGQIAIILDGVVQSAPVVQAAITNGQVSITGNYDLDGAKGLQTILESGSLPVSFTYEQSQTVGPTLGQGELLAGVISALVGLAVVIIYLLFFYRGLGIMIAANMTVFAITYLGLLAVLSLIGVFSLSLAGIAGIILTIGMAADSSILITERFKEEIKMGRNPRAAARSGSRHAILTSIDAEVVTLISALCLFFLAASSVKGFGLTLALGILCDIFVTLLFKGPLMQVLGGPISRHPVFWGLRKPLAFAASRGLSPLPEAQMQKVLKAPVTVVEPEHKTSQSATKDQTTDESKAVTPVTTVGATENTTTKEKETVAVTPVVTTATSPAPKPKKKKVRPSTSAQPTKQSILDAKKRNEEYNEKEKEHQQERGRLERVFRQTLMQHKGKITRKEQNRIIAATFDHRLDEKKTLEALSENPRLTLDELLIIAPGSVKEEPKTKQEEKTEDNQTQHEETVTKNEEITDNKETLSDSDSKEDKVEEQEVAIEETTITTEKAEESSNTIEEVVEKEKDTPITETSQSLEEESPMAVEENTAVVTVTEEEENND